MIDRAKLITISSFLLEPLIQYVELTQRALSFGKFCPLSLASEDKDYFAKTVVPFTFFGEDIGNAVVIAFRQGDGTGNDETYTLDDLEVPDNLRYVVERASFPRDKTGVENEFYIPLFTFYIDSNNEPKKVLFASSLEEITVVDGELEKLWDLGLIQDEFRKAIVSGIPPKPRMHLTVSSAQQIGNPHSIHYRPGLFDHDLFSDYADLCDKEIIQVGAFLSFKKKHIAAEHILRNRYLFPGPK